MVPAGVSVAIIGAGDRGAGYATFSEAHPDRVKVVAVAEPRAEYRERMAVRYGLAADRVFERWEDVFAGPQIADAVIITTPDRLHAGPAIQAARKGYHVMLEKPMATSEADCVSIVEAVEDAGVVFSVCHPYRYIDNTRLMKSIIDSGAIGDVASVQHLEPVGYWHQAHSFVRGNWRNEAGSSFMLLTKSCHDLDWLRYMVGKRCTRASSFGSLMHFNSDNRPEGAADRCLDCSVEADCPYSAKRIYLEASRAGKRDWPITILTPDPTPENVEEALRSGPYGRCVYDCDNDVVDHQVVNLEFAGGATASFTMTAFTNTGHRKTHVFGTRGHLYSDGVEIQHFDFLSHSTRVIPIEAETPLPPVLTGHGGGDYLVMDRFVRAVESNDPDLILSGARETLETHRMVFAAERSRREGRVVEVGA